MGADGMHGQLADFKEQRRLVGVLGLDFKRRAVGNDRLNRDRKVRGVVLLIALRSFARRLLRLLTCLLGLVALGLWRNMDLQTLQTKQPNFVATEEYGEKIGFGGELLDGNERFGISDGFVAKSEPFADSGGLRKQREMQGLQLNIGIETFLERFDDVLLGARAGASDQYSGDNGEGEKYTKYDDPPVTNFFSHACE